MCTHWKKMFIVGSQLIEWVSDLNEFVAAQYNLNLQLVIFSVWIACALLENLLAISKSITVK